jgi:RNA-directed DNA polymerase
MALEEPHTRFTSLMGLLFDPAGLSESFGRQDGCKAPGVDGIRKDDLYPIPWWKTQTGSRMV